MRISPRLTLLALLLAGCQSARAPVPVTVTCVSRVEPVACACPAPPAPPATAVTPPARAPGTVVRWGSSWQPAAVLGAVCNGLQRVRFASDAPDDTEVVSARDVQETDARGNVPEVHTPPPGGALLEGVLVPVREPLLAHYGGVWYPAHALRPSRSGAVRIRYDGYGSEWDENLPRASLRRPTGEPLTHPVGRPMPAGEPVAQGDPLAPGTPVEARARGRWFDAQVLHAECEGYVRVHLLGWEPAWDAVVARDRLRRLTPRAPGAVVE